MRAKEIAVGQLYACKVSGNVVPVRIDRALGRGKYTATNTKTGRAVRVSSARLRWAWGDAEGKRRYYAPAPSTATTRPTEPAPTLEAIVGFSALRNACGYRITCRCGDILDARHAVLIEATTPTGHPAGHVVLCETCYAVVADRIAELGALVVCDGRTVGGAVRMVEGMVR